MSEFGIGPWRKANEEFLATFEGSYQLTEQRIGAPSSVDVATGAWVGGWVGVVWSGGWLWWVGGVGWRFVCSKGSFTPSGQSGHQPTPTQPALL